MFNKCCIVNCASRRGMNVSFHKFPKSEIGLQKWLLSINCDELRNLSYQDLYKQYVCQLHFEKRFFSATSGRVRLVSDAYPTLFSAKDIESGIPQAAPISFTKPVTAYQDHNYVKRYHIDHTYCKPDNVQKHSRTETDMEATPSSSSISNLTMTSASMCGIEHIEKPAITEMTTEKKTRKICSQFKLTPEYKGLYKEFKKSQKQLNFYKRAKRASSFAKNKSFLKLTQKMNPIAQKFIWMQIKQCTKKSRGRRFSNDEKLIAMSIMKQSPKCYKFLRKIFILPSRYTINKMITELDIGTGINPQIFEAVKKEVSTWSENKKLCSILFDEVALEAALSYDKHKDIINGFVELSQRTNDFADHALVFMLRGVVNKWQQPVAFYFCKGATSSAEFKKIIEDMVLAVSDTGLIPITLICDQGTAFQSAIKNLREDARREQIIGGDRTDDVVKIGSHILSVIYDPSHLIKGLRNNFLNKDIKYGKNISKWADIIEIYKTDCNHAEMRLLHKLNDEHVIPEKIKKMKVKNCTRVFSKTVAATLSYTAQFSHYANGSAVSPTLKNTAEIISFFDDLFDSVNGYNRKCKGKPLRQAITNKSLHHEFWNEAIEKLINIKFVNIQGKETSVPSLKNWISTLKLPKSMEIFKRKRCYYYEAQIFKF